MNKKEPTRYSMSTGLPHTGNDEEVKKYPLESAEQAFLNFIQKAKERRGKKNERKKQIEETKNDTFE